MLRQIRSLFSQRTRSTGRPRSSRRVQIGELSGGGCSDNLYGGDGSDVLAGGDHADVLDSGRGDNDRDWLYGDGAGDEFSFDSEDWADQEGTESLPRLGGLVPLRDLGFPDR